MRFPTHVIAVNCFDMEVRWKGMVIGMIDQYKKETSQVHAPADLVQRTKLAMQQEEQRLSESGERIKRADLAAGAQRETAADPAKKRAASARRIYKWGLPLTAAAAILIFISVSTAIRGIRFGNFDTDMAADRYSKNMELQLGDAGIAEEATEESEIALDEDSSKPSGQEAAENYDMVESAENYDMAESAENEAKKEPMESKESAMDAEENAYAEATTESAADMECDKLTEPATSGAPATDTVEIEITEVDEEPESYNSPDSNSYLYENLLFWADQDENGYWSAYVGVRGDKYVITSTIEDREKFLEKAYELVLETRGSLR